MVDPDRRFVRFAKNGNKAAFGKLVRKYRKPILELVFDYLRNYDQAQDVAQEVFIKAFRNIREFEEKSLFSSWLYRIAVNASLDALKQIKRKKTQPLESIITQSAEQIKDDEPQQNEELIKTMASLSQNQRTAIVLRYFHHQSVHQISEVLDCSESTVRIHLHRAIDKLRKKLK